MKYKHTLLKEDKLIAPAGIGCFPNVYAALAPAGVDQIITL